MKKYIILLLFFINFAFVFQHGMIEVKVGMEAKGQTTGDEAGDGYNDGVGDTDNWVGYELGNGIFGWDYDNDGKIDQINYIALIDGEYGVVAVNLSTSVNNNEKSIDDALINLQETDPDLPEPLSPDDPLFDDNFTNTNAQSIANEILTNRSIKPATLHSSGVSDNASAKQNLIDAANGENAHTSCYGNAPCTTVGLSVDLLNGIQSLSDNFTFSISEIAGGSHSVNSTHYSGNAIDVNYVNGDHVPDMTESQVDAFRQAAFDEGATKVFDPYHDPDGSHGNHFHIQW